MAFRRYIDKARRLFENSSPRHDIFKVKDRVLRVEILDDGFESEQLTKLRTQPTDEQESDSCKVLRVITTQISSIMFVNKSTFFYKMFSNGMKESNELEFTLKISSYEEAAFMDLLDYLKADTLPKRKDPSVLLELLIMADKFEVSSCIKSCLDKLLSFPMTCELALLFSGLPNTISMSSTYQSLMDSAQKFYAETLYTLDVFPEDIGDLDQAIIETILSRNDLLLVSEDEAYDFLMKWVAAHFSDSEKKREFLHSNVRNLIRFPYMSDSKLSEFYIFHPCTDKEFAKEIKLECDVYKEQQRKKECTLEKVELRSSNKLMYVKRFYAIHPVIVEKPKARGEGYNVLLKMEKEECRNLERVAFQYTDTFVVGGQEFYLAVECKSQYRKDKPYTLGMRLHSCEVQRLMVLDFKVEVKKADGGIMTKGLERVVLNRRKRSAGIDYLFDTKWDDLMAEDSKFFVNGIMSLIATIGIME